MVADGEWQSDLLDLHAYLARIGVTGPLPADERTLALLHRAHVLSIPFENVDIALGRGVSLDLDAVQAKLVGRRRGGYCYEHTLLFGAALERLGFPVRRLSGRTRMGTDEVRARTHVALLVGEPGHGWLADVGLGSAGPIGPLPWRDGQRCDEGRWSYRLDRDHDDLWVLRIRRPDGWFDLYSIDSTPQHHIDYEVGNHYVSTHPDSPFARRLVAGSTRTDRRMRLAGRTCTVEWAPGEPSTRELGDAEFERVLTEDMGIGLDADDLPALTAMTRPILVDR
ncbi:MAG TPA: arylamine N-acetyltransferase [Pseudonocardiaceae bacterium]